MSVQEYLDKHTLARKIEDAVNAAVRAKATDPVLFISNHMAKTVPSAITNIKARMILDSRGIPAVEVDLYTNKGMYRASAPSGTSIEMYGAIDIRDGDKGKFLGKCVSKDVKNINEKISEVLIGMDPSLQSQIDQAMMDLEKTQNKAEVGANAMLAVSIAACRAGAAEKEVPLYKHIADLSGKGDPVLPVPAITVISGGSHAGNNLPVKEFMIMPVGASNFEEAIQMGSDIFFHLKSVIFDRCGSSGCNVGEDGGFAPNISSISEGLDFIKEAIHRAGYNERIKLALGIGATEFCIGKKYDLDYKIPNKSGKNLKTGEDMIEMYNQLCADYPIVSVEQPFDKDDWEHTKIFTALGICQVVGGDLLMSNPERIGRAIQEGACNALLLKVVNPMASGSRHDGNVQRDTETERTQGFTDVIPAVTGDSGAHQMLDNSEVSQIGTITECIKVVKQAKDAQWGILISHRIGETEDSFIADFSVGLATGQIKAGAPCRGERLAKYNQLLRIEEELGGQAVYAGENWRNPFN